MKFTYDSCPLVHPHHGECIISVKIKEGKKR